MDTTLKAILEFDLNDPDANSAFERCVAADRMASMLWELMYNTKKKLEWDIEQNNYSAYDVLDKMYECIFDLATENSVDIDHLYK